MRRELDAERASHSENGVEARLRARGQSLVQTLPTQPGILGNLRHALGARDIAERQEKKIGVLCLEHGGHVLGNGVFIREVAGRIEREKLCLGSRGTHDSGSNCCKIFCARLISLAWADLSP